ncbi:MAG TPA: putative sulfate exporter family transporter [Nocardioidaceae bacterium]|nr:putative sulfate exporter family transporter [Nocardioidaceae bacterium]
MTESRLESSEGHRRRWWQVAAVLPGLAVAGLVALAAYVASLPLPSFISDVGLAVVFGAAVATLVRLPAGVRPGIDFAMRRVLRLGIIALGARLSFEAVISLGASTILLVTGLVGLTLIAGVLLGRSLGLSGRLPLLIAVGTAICGNTAIIATAPVVDADERDVSFAVATITLVGLTAVLVYPVLGVALGLSDTGYGMWAGTAIGDTSQVVAAGFGYTTGAGEVATIVKLTRNVLIAPVVLGAGLLASSGTSRPTSGAARKAFPLFVLGFLAMVALASLGALEPAVAGRPLQEWVVLLSELCILVALAGVGLATDLRAILRTGLKPLYMGFLLAAGLSVTSLLLLGLLGHLR